MAPINLKNIGKPLAQKMRNFKNQNISPEGHCFIDRIALVFIQNR